MATAVRSDTEAGPAQIVRTSYSYDAVGRMTNLHHRDNSGGGVALPCPHNVWAEKDRVLPD